MIDITAPKHLEIVIRDDGKIVWINDETQCVLRACQIGDLILKDERRAPRTKK